MSLYYLKFRKNTESKNAKKKNYEYRFYQNLQCVIVKTSKFIKGQKASELLSSLEIKTPLKFL